MRENGKGNKKALNSGKEGVYTEWGKERQNESGNTQQAV
jgi:hypothetical protein